MDVVSAYRSSLRRRLLVKSAEPQLSVVDSIVKSYDGELLSHGGRIDYCIGIPYSRESRRARIVNSLVSDYPGLSLKYAGPDASVVTGVIDGSTYVITVSHTDNRG